MPVLRLSFLWSRQVSPGKNSRYSQRAQGSVTLEACKKQAWNYNSAAQSVCHLLDSSSSLLCQNRLKFQIYYFNFTFIYLIPLFIKILIPNINSILIQFKDYLSCDQSVVAGCHLWRNLKCIC